MPARITVDFSSDQLLYRIHSLQQLAVKAEKDCHRGGRGGVVVVVVCVCVHRLSV